MIEESFTVAFGSKGLDKLQKDIEKLDKSLTSLAEKTAGIKLPPSQAIPGRTRIRSRRAYYASSAFLNETSSSGSIPSRGGSSSGGAAPNSRTGRDIVLAISKLALATAAFAQLGRSFNNYFKNAAHKAVVSSSLLGQAGTSKQYTSNLDTAMRRRGGGFGEAHKTLSNFSGALGAMKFGDMSLASTLGDFGISGIMPGSSPKEILDVIYEWQKGQGENEKQALFNRVGLSDALQDTLRSGEYENMSDAAILEATQTQREDMAREVAIEVAKDIAKGVWGDTAVIKAINELTDAIRNQFPLLGDILLGFGTVLGGGGVMLKIMNAGKSSRLAAATASKAPAVVGGSIAGDGKIMSKGSRLWNKIPKKAKALANGVGTGLLYELGAQLIDAQFKDTYGYSTGDMLRTTSNPYAVAASGATLTRGTTKGVAIGGRKWDSLAPDEMDSVFKLLEEHGVPNSAGFLEFPSHMEHGFPKAPLPYGDDFKRDATPTQPDSPRSMPPQAIPSMPSGSLPDNLSGMFSPSAPAAYRVLTIV